MMPARKTRGSIFGIFSTRSNSLGGTLFRSIILRFVLPLALASCVVAFLGLPYIQKLLAEWFSADVEVRAQLIMHTVESPIAGLVAQDNEVKLRSYLARMTAYERLLAVLICRPDGTPIARS